MGGYLNEGQPIEPHQVQMIYWFTAEPKQPEVFPYSQAQYQADCQAVSQLIEQVQACAESEFPMTAQPRFCELCVYRSFCDRGVQAGQAAEWEEMDGSSSEIADFDFDQIGEISAVTMALIPSFRSPYDGR